MHRILASVRATNLLDVTLLIPVSAILPGALVSGETLELIHFAGMALTAVSLLAVDRRLWRSKSAIRVVRSSRPG